MPKIDRVEIRVTDYTSRLKRTTMHGDYDTGASGTLLGKPCLLRIFADGITGYAQVRPTTPGHSMPDTWKSVSGAFEEIIGPMLIGRDIFDINAIFAEFDMVLPYNPVVRTMLDFALHDAQGKATNQPVHNLLGGLSQELLPLEWSISMYDDPQQSINDALRGKQEFGINVACLKAGSPKGWRHDVMCFEKLRESCGPEMELGMYPNTAWSVPDTVLALEACRDARLDYIEQPIERRDHAGLANIRRSARGTKVMADEAVMSVQDAYDLAKAEACDVFCVKLYRMGGLKIAQKIAGIAEGANILINIGGLAVMSQLEAAAAAHFYASLPARRCMPAGEFIFGLGVSGEDPLVPEPDFKIENGHVRPPAGPGLGINIDEKALEKYTLYKEVIS